MTNRESSNTNNQETDANTETDGTSHTWSKKLVKLTSGYVLLQGMHEHNLSKELWVAPKDNTEYNHTMTLNQGLMQKGLMYNLPKHSWWKNQPNQFLKPRLFFIIYSAGNSYNKPCINITKEALLRLWDNRIQTAEHWKECSVSLLCLCRADLCLPAATGNARQRCTTSGRI
jgi:hypothetical protein